MKMNLIKLWFDVPKIKRSCSFGGLGAMKERILLWQSVELVAVPCAIFGDII